jgi:MarR family transcriptional regulator for hemolysin
MPSIKSVERTARVEFADELSKVSRKMRTLFDARVKTIGLTLSRAKTLLLLARKDGVTQTELADALEVEGPTLVRLLDGLEKQLLIQRLSVEGDRRAKHIALTAGGRKLATDLTRVVDDFRRDVLAGVDPQDVTAAIRLLRNMSRNMEAASQSDSL